MALTICNSICLHWKVLQMVRKFPPFRSERKKRSTSEGTPLFPNGISGRLPYHLTSNRNYRIFWPNGKHPEFLQAIALFAPVPYKASIISDSLMYSFIRITLFLAHSNNLLLWPMKFVKLWPFKALRLPRLQYFTNSCRFFLALLCADFSGHRQLVT